MHSGCGIYKSSIPALPMGAGLLGSLPIPIWGRLGAAEGYAEPII